MKLKSKKLLGLPVLILLLVPIIAAAESPVNPVPNSESMTVWQARRAIAESQFIRGAVKHRIYPVNGKSVHFTSDSFEFDVNSPSGDTQHYRVDLKAMEEVSFKCQPAQCWLTDGRGKALFKQRGNALGTLWWDKPDTNSAICPAQCRREVESFAAAINRLRAFANDNGAAWSHFQQQAAAWRALPSKPPITEAARVQRLLAEDAVKQKRPEEALNYYEEGLKICPTWPEGYFNAALVAASLGFYDEAAEDMQKYLELLPDAKDAQAARDQIAIWQYKAKQNSAN